MATFDTLGFVEEAKKNGWKDSEIHSYLTRNGYDPSLPSQEVSTGVGGFAKGVAKGVGSTVTGLAQMVHAGGTALQAGLDPTKTFGEYRAEQRQNDPIGIVYGSEKQKKLENALTARGTAEKVGKGVEFAGELVSGAIASKLPKVLSKIPGAGKAPGFLSEVTMGTKGSRAMEEAFTNPATQRKVLSGEITPTTIAAKIKDSATTFKTESIKALETAKEGLENFNIGKKKVLSEVNDGLRKSLGIDEGAKIDLSKLPITQEAERIVSKLQQTIASHRDWSRKGILELRELIDRQGFYKAGNQLYYDSNKVVTALRGKLNELVAAGDESFKLSLESASKDIDFLRKLGINVIGKSKDNVTLGASKVKSLINAIEDPGTRQEALDLVQRLAAETGSDIYDEILSLSRSKSLMDDLPGLKHPIDTSLEVLNRGAAATARTLGSIKNTVGEMIENGVGNGQNVRRLIDEGVEKGKDIIEDVRNASKKN